MTDQQIEAIAELAARKALASIGLHDETAADDIKELRGLLDTWREVRCTIARTTLKWLTTVILTAIAGVVGLKLYGRG